jgi:hypothetical protein
MILSPTSRQSQKRADTNVQNLVFKPIRPFYTVLRYKKGLQLVEGKETLWDVLDWFREEKYGSSNNECTLAFANEDNHTFWSRRWPSLSIIPEKWQELNRFGSYVIVLVL